MQAPLFVNAPSLWHVSQDGRDGRRSDALERSHEACFAYEGFARLDSCAAISASSAARALRRLVICAFRLRLTLAWRACSRRFNSAEKHLLNLIAPGFQLPERETLRRRRNIEAKSLRS